MNKKIAGLIFLLNCPLFLVLGFLEFIICRFDID